MANELREPGGPDEFETAPLATGFDGTRSEQLICDDPGGRCEPPAWLSFRARFGAARQHEPVMKQS